MKVCMGSVQLLYAFCRLKVALSRCYLSRAGQQFDDTPKGGDTMPGISTFVQLRTVTDRPIVAGGMRLLPQSQLVLVRLPCGGFGSFWERPTVVVVERGGRVI